MIYIIQVYGFLSKNKYKKEVVKRGKGKSKNKLWLFIREWDVMKRKNVVLIKKVLERKLIVFQRVWNED